MPEPLPKVPIETAPIETDKPKSSNIAIKIMVSLLILVVLSEIGYLIYNNYFKPTDSFFSGPTIEQESIIKDASPTTNTESQMDNNKYETTNNLSQEVINNYNHTFSLKNVYFKNALVSYTSEGKIVEIFDKTKIIDDIKYPYGIELKFEKGGMVINFNQREIITTKVTNPNNPDKNFDLKDLTVGQKVSITITTNLINNPNSNSNIFINILE